MTGSTVISTSVLCTDNTPTYFTGFVIVSEIIIGYEANCLLLYLSSGHFPALHT